MHNKTLHESITFAFDDRMANATAMCQAEPLQVPHDRYVGILLLENHLFCVTSCFNLFEKTDLNGTYWKNTMLLYFMTSLATLPLFSFTNSTSLLTKDRIGFNRGKVDGLEKPRDTYTNWGHRIASDIAR